jgi:hypothetical protein
MAKVERRTREEVLKLVAEVDKLREGGMQADTAAEKVGLARSVYWKHKKPKGQASPVVRGSVRADSLPPRPKKGGKRVPKKVDLTDIGSVAVRIAKLDKKLRDIDGLVKERIDLVAVLIKLLKDKK